MSNIPKMGQLPIPDKTWKERVLAPFETPPWRESSASRLTATMRSPSFLVLILFITDWNVKSSLKNSKIRAFWSYLEITYLLTSISKILHSGQTGKRSAMGRSATAMFSDAVTAHDGGSKPCNPGVQVSSVSLVTKGDSSRTSLGGCFQGTLYIQVTDMYISVYIYIYTHTHVCVCVWASNCAMGVHQVKTQHFIHLAKELLTAHRRSPGPPCVLARGSMTVVSEH